MRQLDETPASDTAVDQPAAQADALLELYAALLGEFPDASFAARALIAFGAAMGPLLPVDQRIALAQAMFDRAADLVASTQWH